MAECDQNYKGIDFEANSSGLSLLESKNSFFRLDSKWNVIITTDLLTEYIFQRGSMVERVTVNH